MIVWKYYHDIPMEKSAILIDFNSVLFKSNILHKLCSLLQFFAMLSCDNAVWIAEINEIFGD